MNGKKSKKKLDYFICHQRHFLAGCLILCLILSSINGHFMRTYAKNSGTVSFDIGADITAVLEDGKLTISGQGATMDFTETSAPFAGYSDEIHTLVINEGITYIGAYLFFGLGGLRGVLTLPGSITEIGDYAFSGASLADAPGFTLIRNEFVEGQIVLPAKAELESRQTSVVGSGMGEESMPASEPAAETFMDGPGESGVVGADESAEVSGVAGASDVMDIESGSAAQPGTEESETNSESSQTEETDTTDVITEHITQQKIEHPETLFYKGQTGNVICSETNLSFRQAAEAAGYVQADGLATVTLDDTLDIQLPVVSGKLILPECPESIISPYADDPLIISEFSGWRNGELGESGPVMAAGEAMDAQVNGHIKLYSVWETTPVNNLTVDSSEQAEAPESSDVRIVYVAQSNGDDANGAGSETAPFKTMAKAAEWLVAQGAKADDTVNTNQIVLLENYDVTKEYQDGNLFGIIKTPVTIKGKTPKITIVGATNVSGETDFFLHNNLTFESITFEKNWHIYANGYNLTLGDNISKAVNPAGTIYLYGADKSGIGDGTGRNITVKSGDFVRIAACARSGILDMKNTASSVTIAGNAKVTTLIAGSASDSISNSNVTINICDEAQVTNLIGGCQGFSAGKATYTGKTSINITGGNVTSVYGAGSGRQASIPTFKGDLDISVSGGKVGNIYGSGSAAYIISNDTERSNVNITLTGGNVENIYTAGLGGDTGVYDFTTTGQETVKVPNPHLMGSLTGDATITIDGMAVIGNIYASGQGYNSEGKYETAQNAFLDGNAKIAIHGGTIRGNVFGGGAGINDKDYEQCARVTETSKVDIEVTGGTIVGNIYGGGQNAKVEGSTSVQVAGGTVEGYVFGGGQFAEVVGSAAVTVSGGTIKKNVYGGGQEGLVRGSTTVNINNGTVEGSLYGGALGIPKNHFVYGGSTVNMTGGWIRGNIYGGSELSNDGPKTSDTEKLKADMVFVNLAGGIVDGKVFGGSYQGIVNGSTHVHIGMDALNDCNYYKENEEKKPALTASNLSIKDSVYAGGDYGGESVSYDTVTVTGFSHIYIDGTDYNFGASEDITKPEMSISGGVFGSGASCDAGDIRLVTLENYGAVVKDDAGNDTGVTETLTSIQRADQVRLINTHIRLSGQSDVANANQTALYSLNRIGDHGNKTDLEPLGNGLMLIGGSTLVLDSAAIELANYKSVAADGKVVTLDGLKDTPNTLWLTTGTVFRVSCKLKSIGDSNVILEDEEIYGAVTGYSYIIAGDTALAYAYARIKDGSNNKDDGGFAAPGEITELEYTNVGTNYRYWQVAGDHANATRHTVLTAQQLDTYPEDGFCVATGEIELSPVNNASTYKIKSITLPGDIQLVDAAKNGDNTQEWIESGTDIEVENEKAHMETSPLKTFGLYMQPGSGFSDVDKKVISNNTANVGYAHTIINKELKSTATGILPKIEFYLTYHNTGITVSQDLGAVVIVLERSENSNVVETITMNVEIVTKAAALSEQSVDLYATQNGTYKGRLVIPAGASRKLSLSKVNREGLLGGSSLVTNGSDLTDHNIAITMQPTKTGWLSSGLMSKPYDLSTHSSSDILIGTTDSRYEAVIDFSLYNMKNFNSKSEIDKVVLTLKDGDDKEVFITLNIHWEKSIVSGIKVSTGKDYNSLADENNIAVCQESAITAAFTLNKTAFADELWLELQKSDFAVALPAGTRLTLLGNGNKYYIYIVQGSEDENKIALSGFREMWSDSTITGSISQELTFIVDFDQASTKISTGTYSLRLRTDKAADSMGADFTVNNTASSAAFSGGDGYSRGEHKFQLSINSGSDTRLTDGMAVVLSPGSEDGGKFPDWVVFRYNNTDYHPMNGKIYIPLQNGTNYNFTMDTTLGADGLSIGKHQLIADIYSVGENSGSLKINTVSTEYMVVDTPSYALKVELSKGSRAVRSGTALEFKASGLATGVSAPVFESVNVEVQWKDGATYKDCQPWVVAGNTVNSMTFTDQIITVTVPDDAKPGTYRLIFTLGSQEVPYNIIVQ